jgi:hypothetical protein
MAFNVSVKVARAVVLGISKTASTRCREAASRRREGTPARRRVLRRVPAVL